MKTRQTCLGLLVALTVCHNPAQSAVYRCELADGTFVFQQSACYSGHEPLEMTPLNTLGDGLRKTERKWLKSRTRRSGRSIEKTRSGDVVGKQRQDAEKCLKKKQLLERVQAKLRRGYKPAQGDALRRQRDDYAEYLRAFCR